MGFILEEILHVQNTKNTATKAYITPVHLISSKTYSTNCLPWPQNKEGNMTNIEAV